MTEGLSVRGYPRGREGVVMSLRWAVVALGGLLLTGCATSDELDQIRATMDATMVAHKRAFYAKARTLNEASQQAADAHVRLTRQLDTLDGAITAHERLLAERERMLRLYQDRIRRLADIVHHLSQHVRETDGAMRDRLRVLEAMLEQQEAFHREGLRTVRSIRQEVFPYGRGSPRRSVALW